MYKTLAMWVAGAALVGCEASFKDPETDGDFTDTTYDADADTDADTDDGTTRPPEEEDRFIVRPPAQTDAFVFIANPARDTLTRVHVASLSVVTTQVGINPQIVLTTPNYTTAVVFNQGDASVTLVDAVSLAKRTVPVRDHLNDMVLSPTGGHAVLWHNNARDRPGDPVPDGLQSFNEASFVDVTNGTHFPMAVGFNPHGVRFTPDGRLAVVVADAYLATVDLTAETLAPRLLELAPDEIDAPVAEEVIVAADGSFAWVRQFGATELLVVDLDTGEVDRVAAGDNPTDLDLSHDGSQAIAVARASDELYVFDASDPFVAPSVVGLPTGSRYGSLLVDPSGDKGILYTTASLDERYAVWDRLTDEVRERPLVKPVRGMVINPTGEALLIDHTRADGPLTEPTFARQHALTMVSLADLRSNPLLLPAEITGFANGTDGSWGVFVMEDEPFLEVLDYRSLLHHQVQLRSVPEYVGVFPDLVPEDDDAPPAWVSQQHALGRISFYDPDDGSLETLTGFELNSDIETD